MNAAHLNSLVAAQQHCLGVLCLIQKKINNVAISYKYFINDFFRLSFNSNSRSLFINNHTNSLTVFQRHQHVHFGGFRYFVVDLKSAQAQSLKVCQRENNVMKSLLV